MNVLDLLIKKLAEDRQTYERAVLTGGPKDFAEFRHSTGVIQGLTRAENIVKDLVQKLEKNDE